MSYVVYKIVSESLPEFVYVGSTMAFAKRKCQHKTSVKNINSKLYNIKLYETIRDNGGWENWRMVVIHECETGMTKLQAHILEEEHRIKLQANLNTKRCHRTEEERKIYNQENRVEHLEQKKEYDQEYRQEHKIKIAEKQKEYNQEHKAENAIYQKEYKQENKIKISEKMKDYYLTKKEELSEKVTCECGCIVNKCCLTRHRKTKKHLTLMEPVD